MFLDGSIKICKKKKYSIMLIMHGCKYLLISWSINKFKCYLGRVVKLKYSHFEKFPVVHSTRQKYMGENICRETTHSRVE